MPGLETNKLKLVYLGNQVIALVIIGVLIGWSLSLLYIFPRKRGKGGDFLSVSHARIIFCPSGNKRKKKQRGNE